MCECFSMWAITDGNQGNQNVSPNAINSKNEYINKSLRIFRHNPIFLLQPKTAESQSRLFFQLTDTEKGSGSGSPLHVSAD